MKASACLCVASHFKTAEGTAFVLKVTEEVL